MNQNRLRCSVLVGGLLIALAALSTNAAPPKSKPRTVKPKAQVITIGDPREDSEVAKLTYGNTLEYARKLWGPEAERTLFEDGVT